MGKKALSVFMTAVMVAQMYTSPIQTAYAQSTETAAKQQVAQMLEESQNNDADAQSEDSESKSVVDDTTTPAQETNDESTEPAANDAAESEGSAAADAETAEGEDSSKKSSKSSDDADAQSDAAIMPVAADGTTDGSGDVNYDAYTPDAAAVKVTTESGTTTFGIYYDREGTNSWNGEAITGTDELYAKVNTQFNTEHKPTAEQPNVYYEFPDAIKVADQAKKDLYDSTGSNAGTWEIKDNKVYLYFSESWLNAHPSEVKAYFTVEMSLADSTKGDGGSSSFVFPGTSTTVTIPTKDGTVSGDKRAFNYDATTNSYTWVISVTPKAEAHKLVITDTIGTGLDFVDGSFVMCDYNGNPTGEAAPAVTYSTDGKTATITLGDRSAGTYYVKYTTTLNSNATDGLKDGDSVKNVDNKVSWSWGSTSTQKSDEVTVTPNKVKYSMVEKSAAGTNTDITWTVKLNNGTLKADMSNYVFTDTLTGEHHFLDGTQYTVTDASGNTVASGNVDASSKTLTFTLPSTVGKQSLTVTYHTAMDDPTAAYATVKNTSTVTPHDDRYPSGTGEAGYTPSDDRVYVGKSLVSKSDNGSEANWTSTVYFSNMASNTDVSKVSWTDTIELSPYQGAFNPMVFSDVVLKTSDGATLTEGTDYTVNTDGSAGTYKVTFIASSTVSGLVGKGDVVITYKTAPKNTSAVADAGSKFTNTSTVQVNGVTKGTATASYDVEASVPSIEKSSSTAQWDADKNGWVVTWTVNVNKAIVNYQQTAVVDTKGEPITVKDTLPSGMTYVDGSASYKLSNSAGYYSYQYTGTPTVTDNGDGTMSFEMATKGHDNNGDYKIYATLTYKTFVSASSLEPGQTMSFTNSADGETGNTKFPGGTSTTTITNDVLSKTHGSGTDEAHVKYTIVVNPNALDLVDGDTVTLEDTMSSTLSYSAGSFKVVDANGNDVTSSCSISASNVEGKDGEDTLLTIKVPDATKLTITYECMPLGYVGQTVTISNEVKLEGQTGGSKSDSTSWKVQKSSAGADATSYGLTVNKIDEDNNAKKLAGAEFTVYEASSTGEKGDKVASATTGTDGVATIGSKENPLEASKLYFVEETKAPAGYEISYEGSYILFYPATATTQAVQDFEKAYADAIANGINPVIGTISDSESTGPGITFNVYDKKSTDANATLHVHKTVTGTTTEKKFQFSLYEADALGQKTTGTTLETVEAAADETVDFSTLTFKTAGTYYYLISETSTLGNGWSKSGDVLATATVTNGTDGALVANVSYDHATTDGNAAEVTNAYTTSGEATISVYKTVNGGTTAKAGETFTFDLYEGDDTTGTKLGTVETVAGEVKSFENVKFTQAGTYTYTIHETGHSTDGWTAASDVTATVTVTDDGEGHLTADVEYSNKDGEHNAALFNNTYEATGSATIEVEKKVNGGTEAAEGEEFTFELYKTDEQGQKTGDAIDTVTVKAGEKKSFTALNYNLDDAGKTYTYVVTETGHNDDGWFAASDVTVTVVCADNNKGGITTDITYSNGTNAALFDNTHSTTKAVINVEKEVNSGAIRSNEKFTFDLYKADGYSVAEDGTVSGTKVASLTIDGSTGVSTGSFDEQTYDAEGSYEYVIHETSNLGDGWKNDSDTKVVVLVSRDEEKKQLTSTVEYERANNDKTAALFNNEYTDTDSATIEVTKKVNGSTTEQAGETFDFDLYEAEGYSVAEDGTVSGTKIGDTVSIKVGETGTFSAIQYTLDDAGKTFTYVIHETGHNTDGWTAASDVTAYVKVTANTDRSLSTAVTYSVSNDDKTAALFNNKYAASGSATVEVHKTVNGGAEAKQGETFTFDLYNKDGYSYNKETGEVSGTKAADTVSVSAGGTVSFKDLTYTSAGTYEYVVHETGHNTNGWTAADDVNVTVTVEDKDGKGTLTATVEYSNGENAAEFNNTFETSTTAELKVNKKVTGGTEAVENEAFTFSLYEADGYSVAEDGTVTGTKIGDDVTVKANGTASFAGLTYSTTANASDAGNTFNYVIHEVGHNDKGWTAAADVEVSVTVTENADRSLTTEVKYNNVKADAAEFTNVYNATGEATITVEKTINGGKMAKDDETFTFDLYNAKQDGDKWVKDGNAIQTNLEVKAGGSASFDALKLATSATEGATTVKSGDVLHYVIHETGHNTDGWTAADDVVATVTVTEGTDGKLTAAVTYSNGNNAAAFDDTYTASTFVNLEATKTLTGRDADADEFSFSVYALDADGNKTGEPVATAKNVAAKEAEASKVEFPAITFDAAGTYNYQIEETVGDNGKVNYDQTKYKAIVTVTKDDATGELSASVKYYNADGSERTQAPAFTNKYTYDGVNADIQVSKQMSGAPLEDYEGQFKFTLTDVDGKIVYATATNDANGIVKFSPNFTNRGDYWYKITEQAGTDSGVFYDTNSYYVNVKIGDSTLQHKLYVLSTTYYKADKKTEIKQSDAVFTNVKSSASADIKVSKTVNGGDIQENEKFTFDLYKADEKGEKTGDVLASATITGKDENPVATFTTQNYETTGTYNYVIHETSDLGTGWTNDGDVKVTVTVTRDENSKKLVADVKYQDDRYDSKNESAKFDNKYADTMTTSINVNKVVAGGTEAVKGETFEFALYEAENYKVNEDGTVSGTKVGDSITVEAGNTASFKGIDYTVADAGKTFNYVIHEVGHNTNGWTAAADVNVKVTVTQNEDRTVSTTVEYSSANADKTAALFTNTYATSGEATISLHKRVNGSNDAVEGETFTFDLYNAKQDESGNWVKDGDKLGTVTANAGQTVSFENLKFTGDDDGQTYHYVITETGHNDEGWFAASDVVATVTVKDAKGDGKLTATVEYSNAYVDGTTTVANFDNTKSTASAEIKVDKTVNGVKDGDVNEKFTFTLTDEEGKQIEGTEEITVNGTSTATFEKLTYDKNGTYKYKVHETSDLGDGWFNAGDVDVTVTVTRNDQTKQLEAKVTYGDSTVDAAKFDNIHSVATAELKAYKTVNGGDIAEGEKFTFQLKDQDGNNYGEEKVATIENQVVTFDELEFDTAGTYTFVIHETSELGDGWTNDDDATVTVTVTRNEEEKTLKVTSIDYGERAYESDSEKMAHFDNKFTTTVDGGIEVNKKVNGGTDAVKGESFTFDIYATDEKGQKTGDKLDTVSVKADETKAFENVKYTTADAGKTFTYVITETGHNDKGWTAASDVTVTVKVTENADRTLNVEREYSNGTNAAEFTNVYATSGEAVLSVYKTANGATSDLYGESFQFTLKDNKTGKIIDLVNVKVGEVIDFNKLQITAEGTYTYTIHEMTVDGQAIDTTKYNTSGWMGAPDVIATVVAKDKGDGTLSVTVSYSKTTGTHNAAHFDNKYNEELDERDHKDKKKTPNNEVSPENNNKKNNGGSSSDKTSTSSSTSKSSATPKTGDTAMSCAPLAAAGGLALAAAALRRNRKRDEE